MTPVSDETALNSMPSRRSKYSTPGWKLDVLALRCATEEEGDRWRLARRGSGRQAKMEPEAADARLRHNMILWSFMAVHLRIQDYIDLIAGVLVLFNSFALMCAYDFGEKRKQRKCQAAAGNGRSTSSSRDWSGWRHLAMNST